mgnify:CR=1 FL=1
MKKKIIKRVIASALSAIIMTQVIPISASAIQNLKRTEISESSLKESVPNIVGKPQFILWLAIISIV